MNSLMTIKESELELKSPPPNFSGRESFTGEIFEIFKNKLVPILHSIFQ